ncbi:Type II secretion system protein D [bacterium HR40]|nr:Type II secretion system protein D [bacterium HR40]
MRRASRTAPGSVPLAALFWVLVCTILPFSASPARAAETLAAERALVVEIGRGRLVRLSEPASGVFVADPAVADVQVHSPRVVYVLGKKAGQTTVFVVDAEDRPLLRLALEVRHAVDELRALVTRAVPESAVTVTSLPGGLMLEGSAPSPVAAADIRALAGRFLGEGEQLIDRLRVTAPIQVSLHVRVAEVSREVTRLFGINWDNVVAPGDFVFGLATGRPFGGGAGNVSRLTDAEGTAGALSGAYRNGDVDINGLLDALEREGLVTVLAQPNLTALSGETAAFLAGGEFPVPVGTDNGDIQIEFKQFGVSLSFTPTVLESRRISLRVRPEVSELSDNGAIVLQNITIPALATRRAETTVELASGQSFAIGGLISSSTRHRLEKFPGLGDLPVLGPLFRSTRFQRDESELVIIVTPYLVQPVAPTALSDPVQGVRPPNEIERLLHGRLAARLGGAPAGGGSLPRLRGGAGFALD